MPEDKGKQPNQQPKPDFDKPKPKNPIHDYEKKHVGHPSEQSTDTKLPRPPQE